MVDRPSLQYLAQLKMQGGHLCVGPCESSDSGLWLVVRNLKSSYMLAQGDVIKFGKSEFLVREIHSTEEVIEDFSMRQLVFGEDSGEEESEIAEFETICRVCLSGRFDSDNPLIAPCHCGGTMKFIHLKCLQNNLKSYMISRSSTHAVSISWDKTCCDLCKKPFPKRICVNGEPVNLIELSKPPGSYIVLENETEKTVVLISFASESSLKLGRSPDCDIQLSEMSVSRTHAKIVHKNGNYYLEDLKSRYGTLVKVCRPITIEHYSPVSLQGNKTLLTLKFNKGLKFIPGCFSSRDSPFDYTGRPIMKNDMIFPISTGIPMGVSDSKELVKIMRQGNTNCLELFDKFNKKSDSDAENVEIAPDPDQLRTIV